MGISVNLLKENLDRALGMGERAVIALEKIAAALPAPKGTVTYEQLCAFAATYAGGRLAIEVLPLWRVLVCSELEARLQTQGLAPVRNGQDLNVAALKRFVSSEHVGSPHFFGVGEPRLELLLRWVASL